MAAPELVKRGDVSTRSAELVVAFLIVLGGAVVIYDSLRVGITWADDGPRAGYFPFFIGCILAFVGIALFAQTLFKWKALATQTFVTRAELKPVLSVLLPTIAYVILIAVIGMYVASAIYIGAFMVWQGKYKAIPTLLVSIGVPVAVFLLFEIWFLVPLPKGPLEHLIGY